MTICMNRGHGAEGCKTAHAEKGRSPVNDVHDSALVGTVGRCCRLGGAAPRFESRIAAQRAVVNQLRERAMPSPKEPFAAHGPPRLLRCMRMAADVLNLQRDFIAGGEIDDGVARHREESIRHELGTRSVHVVARSARLRPL